jgi:peptidoglycan-associated lipoprotein
MIRNSFFTILIFVTAIASLSGCGKQNTKTKITDTDRVVRVTAPPEVPRTATVPEQSYSQQVKKELYFQNVNFEFDKYSLSPDAREILISHAKILKENPTIHLLIEGYCDERGTIEYNLALGDKRAKAVKDYLVRYGIKPENLSTISYGKEKPLDKRATEEAWAKNRRAAFIIQ